MRSPRTNFVAALPRHGEGNLAEVVKVVGCPGGEELGDAYAAQSRVGAGAGKVGRREVKRLQFAQVGCAQASELGKEFDQRLAGGGGDRSVLREGVKGAGLAMLSHAAEAGHPVLLLADEDVKVNS